MWRDSGHRRVRVVDALSRYPCGMLRLPTRVYTEIVSHCLGGLPDEACGLIAGDLEGHVSVCYPTRNAAASARLYTVDPGEQLRAEREAEHNGIEIIGVFHSHTHTDAYPSSTDVEQASTPLSNPEWHYVLVSLRDTHPTLRSYRIVEREVKEESVVLEPGTEGLEPETDGLSPGAGARESR
jgi:[CysO sulfur-carrier protein]-S-L-cysteine hydrolase